VTWERVIKLSFTITCNKCGKEDKFTNESKTNGENISVSVFTRGNFSGDEVESIDIDCDNPKCDNSIEIKY
jgi:hypothetical protein